MSEIDRTDKTTYAPFTLVDNGDNQSIALSDSYFHEKEHIFKEREEEGWLGNGYDWNSVVQVIVKERLPELSNELSEDPEAGMFCIYGSRPALEELGKILVEVYKDDDALRDYLSRAELD